MYILDNGELTAQISKDPFELVSLKKGNKEYVYQKDNVWKKSWPICFPITGKLINNQYRYNGQTYSMNGHGFFRNIINWEVVEYSSTILTVRYESTDEFQDQYPFKFIIYVTYELVGNKLLNKVNIVNNGSEKLPYNFGWHPAFICDDHLGKVIFDRPQTLTHVPLDNFLTDNLPTENINEIFLDKYDFSKSQCYALFDQSTDHILVVDPNRVIKIRTTGYPNVIIWKCNDDAKFICVEPWDGHQDVVNYENTPLDEKPWINLLRKNDNQEYLLEVEIAK
ncbi:aldose epimerase [Spiroplasma eriocheiris]|uniref:Aldose 1-epimerase family protein n=1 Tax=Spiroplasma eriocheiris TaxID=315358 RepID=A0A0H3XI51_9MOLU|nr:aldose epimerase [Spiroplasma eriocheiris]AHF58080.1 putative aldose 1-epimerase [Spiroplasma eriocheiris CCTCC M 207170]AKM54518.1 aldose 1-epimerase family protein [Spiroplasma eriocheiris]